MALDKHTLRFIDATVDLTGKDVLSLGRMTDCVTPQRDYRQRGYAEQLLLDRGATVVESVDVSDHEGATHIHDLSEPIRGTTLEGRRYDAIVDVGTLEHVFDVAQALENVDALLAPGGVFIAHQPLNLVGHGFWSISPELLYRWSLSLGYQSQRCVAYRLGPLSRWREVVLNERTRCEFFLFTPAMYLFKATKPSADRRAPIQAGPSLSPPIKHWVRDTSLWRFGVAHE
jgi:SAM-dependent methyltransferase